jgi:Protein of unknown function (DUF3105)
VAATAIFVAGCGAGNDKKGGSGETSGPSVALESFHNLDYDHVKRSVDYMQSPPVGGDHASISQNCGFYSEPVPNETAVHSMEHGAVWITYRPGLPTEQVDKLRELATFRQGPQTPEPGALCTGGTSKTVPQPVEAQR